MQEISIKWIEVVWAMLRRKTEMKTQICFKLQHPSVIMLYCLYAL